MAGKKKAPPAYDRNERGTFEIQVAQGKSWEKSSTRYNRHVAQMDADLLEDEGKRVRIVKTSDKTAYDQDE